MCLAGVDKKVYEVLADRVGSGALLIKPGLTVAYTGAVASLVFKPVMMQALYTGPLDIEETFPWRKTIEFMEDL